MTVSERAVLREYDSQDLTIDRTTAHRLQVAAAGRLSVSPTEHDNRWTVSTGSHVGTISLPGLQILVRPKVSAANLFAMLEPDGVSLGVGIDQFDYRTSTDVVAVIATFFARLLEWTFVRGVSRAYVEKQERLVALRGRLNAEEQRRIPGLPLPLACRYDEHSADVRVNRVVRAAAERLLVLPGVAPSTRRQLFSLLGRIDEAGRLRAHDLPRVPAYTRLDVHYRAAESFGRLVLRDSSIDEAIEHGPTAEAGVFLIDMNKVFERFVASRLTRLLAPGVRVRGQESTHLDVQRAVGMRPDLVFRRPGDRTALYVGDTKYKISKSGYGRESDYYQLLAYTTALGLPEGVLIYADAEEKEPSSIDVRLAGKTLRTEIVRLTGSSGEIDAEMRRVASSIVDRIKLLKQCASESG